MSPIPIPGGATRERATVESVFIGVEPDHGCTTFSLMMKFDACGQGFGHVVLDDETLPVVRRELCALFGVATFEEIKGRECFVLRCFDSWNEPIEGVEVDGKRWTLTSFRRRCYPNHAESAGSVLDHRIRDLRLDIDRLAKNIQTKNAKLASITSQFVDWEKP